MRNYLDLVAKCINEGVREPNRTGIDTLTLIGETLKFDLRDGFPAVTTKQLAFKSVVGELIGFMRGLDNAADFRSLGCKVWDQNANENEAWLKNPHRKGVDDLGPIYGVQWRRWPGEPIITTLSGDIATPPDCISVFDFTWQGETGNVAQKCIDQLANALSDIRNNPQSRRIKVTAWNPAMLDRVALPACHTDFQFICRSDNTLHMVMSIRSWDLGLGASFNIASYAILLELFALWSGRQAATLTINAGDCHVYLNHVEALKKQLERKPLALPYLEIDAPENCTTLGLDELVTQLEPPHIKMHGYQHYETIKMDMAV